MVFSMTAEVVLISGALETKTFLVTLVIERGILRRMKIILLLVIDRDFKNMSSSTSYSTMKIHVTKN